VRPPLEGKSALVTAASEGLGFACAAALAEAGCSVAICGRRQHALDYAKAELTRRGGRPSLAVAADLSRAEDVAGVVARVTRELGGPDILVVNSGHPASGGFDELGDGDWYAAFELLLMSAVRLTRPIVPAMRARGGGDIVFIGSRAAREPSSELPLSTVMRLGIAGLAKMLATDLARDNIRVNLLLPGYFDTGGNRRRIDELARDEGLPREAANARLAAHIPVGRFGDASDLAALVVFLASRKASFLTGAAIAIDGGASRSPF
jgi:3-oxoacyl-[acyl-carrier protein] reductase